MKPQRPVTLVCVLLGVLLLEGVVRGFPDELLLPAHGWLGEYTFVAARSLPSPLLPPNHLATAPHEHPARRFQVQFRSQLATGL